MKLLIVAIIAFWVGEQSGNLESDQATLKDCAVKGHANMFGGGSINCEVIREKP